MTISPIGRRISTLSHTSKFSPPHSFRIISSSPIRPSIAPPRLYGRRFAPQHYSVWHKNEEHGSHIRRHHAGSRAASEPVLRASGNTSAAVSEEAHGKLMQEFLSGVDGFDPAPPRYSQEWWVRILYEAPPARYIVLVLPDEASREAARRTLEKVCERWDDWVGVLRNCYVFLVVLRDTLDALREGLAIGFEFRFLREAWIHCAVDSRHEMDAILALPGLITKVDASKRDEGEAHRLFLHWPAQPAKNVLVDPRTVEFRDPSSESTTASSQTNDRELSTKATSSRDEQQDSDNREQEQHHGESHNKGKSEQTSALVVVQDQIYAGGNVTIINNIHHGCNASPLSSSSPTVGNNQPNGNEGLNQKK